MLSLKMPDDSVVIDFPLELVVVVVVVILDLPRKKEKLTFVCSFNL